jgi:hypothetical protein
METESVQTPNGENTDNTPQGEEIATPQGDSQGSEDSTDWKAMSRKWEAQAKRDRDRIKSMENALKQAISPDEVQSKEVALVEAQAQATSATREVLRLRVALAEGIPADLADRLRGDTEEEIKADAEILKAMVKPTNPAAEAKKATLQIPSTVKPDTNALLRQIIASR